MDAQREAILEQIDQATEPGKMRWRAAKEFLEELVTDIDGRIEALKEENEDED
jgi:hypothetical protein